MAYNTSVHSSTGFTPFFLMFGRQAKLPIDIVYGSPSPSSDSIGQYASNLKTSLKEAYRKVSATTNTVAERQKELYDRKAHRGMLEVGDLVWLYNPAVPQGQLKKLHCPWTGPFTACGETAFGCSVPHSRHSAQKASYSGSCSL